MCFASTVSITETECVYSAVGAASVNIKLMWGPVKHVFNYLCLRFKFTKINPLTFNYR